VLIGVIVLGSGILYLTKKNLNQKRETAVDRLKVMAAPIEAEPDTTAVVVGPKTEENFLKENQGESLAMEDSEAPLPHASAENTETSTIPETPPQLHREAQDFASAEP